ncbi:unnamed protein product [Spirodela intermedia]|uniref:Fibronectin type III-like domain-containing protein n=1 Tax=Spirodela intermedia TaxID=51605 RepID=A0A7I8J6N7_SPIIN|nr:unnamed protein product [Spirodela intermedia]CAA6665063.1 unnamed protein product [Spirodela intermedia]
MEGFSAHRIFFFLALLTMAGLAAPPARAGAAPYACDASDPATRSYGFCRRTLPIEKRVEDLVSRLTLPEKISQLGNAAAGVTRLGIPAFQWWSESLHGVSNAGRGIRFEGALTAATSFPQVILTAATFNPLLWYRIGQAVGTEARAFYNAGQAEGLALWSPNINIFRDPRWGRGQETPGEDPLTAGKYAVAYVRGLQGDSFHGGSLRGELKASACCKHLTAYDLDHWKGFSRLSFDAKVSAQDLADTYQPPFRSCVMEGQASGIMCSYNLVNGVPTCADYDLLTRTARGSWGFNGYITSDCDAVAAIYENHSYAGSPPEAVADALRAGMDVNCGAYMQKYTEEALRLGKIVEGDINRALRNLFSVRMRLGLFNGNPKSLAFGNLGPSQVCTQEHQDLALEAARDGTVLLKNAGYLLPLSKSKVASIAIMGPNSNNAWRMLGDYAGPPCTSITPLLALKSYVSETHYLPGCESAACPSAAIDEAVKLAGAVDQVVLFMGLDQEQESEDLDRVDLVLPGMQRSLITSVAKAARRPVILVLLCGGPVDVSFVKTDPTVGAIIWAGYPGQAGGTAIAEVLFGDHNPGGRLPVTWYPQEFTVVPMTDMRMRPDPATGYPGRTYRFYTGEVVFPFGYGLSYSSYSYRFVAVADRLLPSDEATAVGGGAEEEGASSDGDAVDVADMSSESCERLKFSAVVGVRNTGETAGRHSVLLFVRRSKPPAGGGGKQLVDFTSVRLSAGEDANLTFVVNPCEHLSRAALDGSKVLDGGSYSLVVGDEEHPIKLHPW